MEFRARHGFAARCLFLFALLGQQALITAADQATVLYPDLSLKVFRQGDTMIVKYISNIANPSLILWCKTEDDLNNLANVKQIDGTEAYNGTQAILNNFGLDWTSCWINLRNTDDPDDSGFNNGNFSMSSDAATQATTDALAASTTAPPSSTTPPPSTSAPSMTSTAAHHSTTTSAAPTNTSSPDSGLSTGAKAGIGVGVALGVIAVVAVGAFYFLRRRRQQQGGFSTDKYGSVPQAGELAGQTPAAELDTHPHPTELPA